MRPRGWRAGWSARWSGVLAALCGAAVATVATCVSAVPAAAAGDPAVDQYILNNPEPGLQAAPAPALAQVIDRIQKLDTNAAGGQPVHVAAQLWEAPDQVSFLAITVIRWPANVDLGQVLHTAVDDECVSLTGNNPPSLGPAPGVSGSLLGTCTSSPSGLATPTVTATLAATSKGPYSALVESIGIGTSPLDATTVTDILSRQDSALPALPFNAGAAAGIGLAVAAVLGGAVGLAVGLARRSQRRRRPAALGGTPGPWPVAGVPVGPPAGAGPWAMPASAGTGPAAAPGQPGAQLARSDWPSSYQSPPSPGWQALSERIAAGQATAASPASAPTAPGWYRDPNDPNVRRYWDGTRWRARSRWDGTNWVSLP